MGKSNKTKRYNGKSGITIEILMKYIGKNSETTKKSKTNNTKKKTITKNPELRLGKLETPDRTNLAMGLHVLERLVNEAFDVLNRDLLAGENDVSRFKKEMAGYRGIMQDCIRRLSTGAKDESELQRRVESLADYYQIAQAARDGVIIKQEKRIEKRNGEKKEIIYDTSMTAREVSEIFTSYERELERIRFNKLNNYLGIGLGVTSIIGGIANSNKKKANKDKGNVTLVTLGSTAITVLKLVQGVLKSGDREELWDIRDNVFRLRNDLLSNEQISDEATNSSVKMIKELAQKEEKLRRTIANKKLGLNITLDLVVALISGMYVNKQVQINENGKIDGKSLASALINLQATKGATGHLINAIQGMVENKRDEEEFLRLSQKVQEILKQMEEKVYPLEGAKKSFNSIKIEEFTGRFYPKKDYETGETDFATIIKIPEFSLKRGDVALVSGESGTGKSTILRFLKRGDINNRKAIELDNGEKVDNLGKEYISFRPSINLGDETNVLYQITGKSSISDLTKEEKESIETVLRELKFDSPKLLEDLASKKFMEFSTGQQRRLALSKLFYRIDDGKSVIIVDEPVGNVEDSLIREQLEMIKKYAERKNVMLILTTHRLDLAEDLATKRYHINKEGVLEQLQVKKKEDIQDELNNAGEEPEQ